MADLNGSLYSLEPTFSGLINTSIEGTYYDITSGLDVIVSYKMRAQDAGASAPGYVTWVVEGAPDLAGAGYAGGVPAPIGIMTPGSVVIVDEWTR